MPSVNDDFANAITVTIATAGGTYTSSAIANTGNTTEASEPAVSASADLSMWFKYTPTSSGTATFDTQLTTAITNTDSYMAIWTGTALNNLVNVASDDDSGGSATSLISGMSVTAGTTYWIQLGGFGLAQMNMRLRVTGPETTGGGATSLTAADSVHAHAAESPTLTQTHALSPLDAAHANTADAPTLTQTHALAPADSAHGHTSDSPTLATGTTLQPADSAHGHAADAPAVTQAHELAPDDCTHAHATEAPALNQVHAFAPADTVHSHTADSSLVVIPSGLPPPAANTVVTAAEVRIVTTPAEVRIVTTPAENRIITD